MSGRKSRNKGKVGEREVAGILRDYGFGEARRGQQFCGAAGDADVIGLPGYHIEVKRVERLDLNAAISQSERDAKDGEKPVVFHRQNRHRWKVTMYLDDFLETLNGR